MIATAPRRARTHRKVGQAISARRAREAIEITTPHTTHIHSFTHSLIMNTTALIRSFTHLLIAIAFATTARAQVLQSEANPMPPTLLELSTIEPASAPPQRYLLIFKTQKSARTWTTIAGYTLIGAGAYLGGQAEYFSRYHGTRRNGDAFHTTRDASLILTGLGAGSLGASITIGQNPKPLEILWKATSSLILYRVVAQATYNQHKPK